MGPARPAWRTTVRSAEASWPEDRSGPSRCEATARNRGGFGAPLRMRTPGARAGAVHAREAVGLAAGGGLAVAFPSNGSMRQLP